MSGCVHFPDDPHSVCSVCKPKPKADPWGTGGSPYRQPSETEAQYHGTCGVCGTTIYPGDLIRIYRSNWAHEDCVRRRERIGGGG